VSSLFDLGWIHLVHAFWKGLDPIGRRVRPPFGDQTPWVTVVGVARNVSRPGSTTRPALSLYVLLDEIPRILPTIQGGRLGSGVGVHAPRAAHRVAGCRAAAADPDAVREVDPALPIIQLRDMEDVFRDSVRRPRMLMQPGDVRGPGAPAGRDRHYGVLSYMVARQRREVGIRMALGAESSVVHRGVMGDGLKLTCAGLVAGLAAALVLTRLMETLLCGVRPNRSGDAVWRGRARRRGGRCGGAAYPSGAAGQPAAREPDLSSLSWNSTVRQEAK